MSLSRWSHGDWYIYEDGGSDDSLPEIIVSGHGHWNTEQVYWNLDSIVQEIAPSNDAWTSCYSRAELKQYLKLWAEYTKCWHNFPRVMRNYFYHEYNDKLKSLQMRGYFRTYCKDPDDDDTQEDIRMFYPELAKRLGIVDLSDETRQENKQQTPLANSCMASAMTTP